VGPRTGLDKEEVINYTKLLFKSAAVSKGQTNVKQTGKKSEK
jgi:hypothetical protein